MKSIIAFLLVFLCSLTACFGDDLESRIKALEDALDAQQKTIAEQQRVIRELKEKVAESKVCDLSAPAAVPAERQTSGKGSLFGGSFMMNPNLSLILNAYGYTSSLKESELTKRGIPTTDMLFRSTERQSITRATASPTTVLWND